jgi:hypothetical protein
MRPSGDERNQFRQADPALHTSLQPRDPVYPGEFFSPRDPPLYGRFYRFVYTLAILCLLLSGVLWWQILK